MTGAIVVCKYFLFPWLLSSFVQHMAPLKHRGWFDRLSARDRSNMCGRIFDGIHHIAVAWVCWMFIQNGDYNWLRVGCPTLRATAGICPKILPSRVAQLLVSFGVALFVIRFRWRSLSLSFSFFLFLFLFLSLSLGLTIAIVSASWNLVHGAPAG